MFLSETNCVLRELWASTAFHPREKFYEPRWNEMKIRPFFFQESKLTGSQQTPQIIQVIDILRLRHMDVFEHPTRFHLDSSKLHFKLRRENDGGGSVSITGTKITLTLFISSILPPCSGFKRLLEMFTRNLGSGFFPGIYSSSIKSPFMWDENPFQPQGPNWKSPNEIYANIIKVQTSISNKNFTRQLFKQNQQIFSKKSCRK